MSTELLVDRARSGDEAAFAELVWPHRRELHVHCYRLLGSVQDAEDVLQETLVAAWHGLAGFQGRASLRTWLYRIATNRCLNALRAQRRRPVPAIAVEVPAPTRIADPLWLDPYPDALLAELPDDAPGPEARYERREAISLAFLTAVQSLPPRQRAVLVLRDVLGYRAAETAGILDVTEDAVTGALKRARAALPDLPPVRSVSTQDRDTADRFAAAIEAGDTAAVVHLLTDDAWLTMPPVPLEYQGPAAIVGFLSVVAFRRGLRRYSLVPTAANGQPAYGCYTTDVGGPAGHPHGLMVLTVVGGRVTAMTRFVDNTLLPLFELPH